MKEIVDAFGVKNHICLSTKMKMLLNLILAIIVHNVLTSEPIHNISTNAMRMPFNNYPPKYYMKLQSSCCFELKGSSTPVFTQIPGLVLSFYHQIPTLYEISFRGHCRIDAQSTYLMLRLRVDGHLIVANYLSSDMKNDDNWDGPYMQSNTQTQFSWSQCSKIDWIYLSAGIHVIDVVAKTNGVTQINGGVLRIKLTQFDHGTDINIPLITPPQISLI